MKEVNFLLDKESKVIKDEFGYTWIKLLLTDEDDFELEAVEAALDGAAGVEMEIHIDEKGQEDEIYIHYLANMIRIPIRVTSLIELLPKCNDIAKAGQIRDYVIHVFKKRYNHC